MVKPLLSKTNKGNDTALPRGLKPRAVVKAISEALLMVGMILALGLIVRRGDPLFITLSPHPLWAVVLAMAIRYGSPTGALVGALCAAAHLVALYLMTGLQMEYAFQMEVRQIIVPLLYVAVGYIVGEATRSRILRGDHFRNQFLEMRQRLLTSEDRRKELEQAYRQLESRVAGQTNTVISLYDSAKQLNSIEREEIYAGLLALLKVHLDVERAGIWVAESDGQFRRVAPPGGPAMPMPALGQAAFQQGQVVSARELFAQQEARPESGLLAGPLRAGESQIEAVVVVESMKFAGFTHTTIRMFDLLLDWASNSLANATRLVEARSHDVFDTDLNLRSETYLLTRGQEELSLAARRNSAVSVLLCRMEGEMLPATRRRLEVAIARVFQLETRLSDVVAYFEGQQAFVLLLPDVTKDRATVVSRRLEERLRQFDFRPYSDQKSLVLRWGVAQRAEETDLKDLIKRAFGSLGKAKL